MLRIILGPLLVAMVAGSTLFLSGGPALAGVTFSEEFMNDPDNIAVGKQIFRKHCSRCHGRKAYPGKAPKLKPKKYKAKFVYNRITKGFRGMPPWKKLYDEKQRKSLTAYIMSKSFTN